MQRGADQVNPVGLDLALEDGARARVFGHADTELQVHMVLCWALHEEIGSRRTSPTDVIDPNLASAGGPCSEIRLVGGRNHRVLVGVVVSSGVVGPDVFGADSFLPG